jgi:hypothetical protein
MRKRKDPNAWFQQAVSAMENPSTSGWLKGALVEAINRDPVDADRDAEILFTILRLRASAVQRGSVPPADVGKSTKSSA